MASEDHCCNV